MKPLLVILVAIFVFQQAWSETNQNQDAEFILPVSPPQKVFRQYETDFGFNHDRGFYFSTVLGPQWNHSIEKPNAKGVRFGGKINAGWFVANGFSLFGSAWGNFLEEASLIAGGPGVALLFNSANIGIDFSVGVGRVFSVIEREDINTFAETVLAANLSFAKYWWLSSSTSLGASLMSGIHGLTLGQGKLNSIGWNIGLGIAFLFG